MNQIAKALNNKFFASVDKSISDKLTKKYGEIIMELTFEITDMHTQRSMGGRTNLRAKCIQDGMLIDLEVRNSEMINKNLIKQKLIEEHDRILKSEEKHKDDISVGSVL